MSFSQSSITTLSVQAVEPELFISWDASAPANAVFQVYVDRRLVWFGASKQCYVPVPANAACRNIWVDVGIVDASEACLDFSPTLASIGQGAGSPQLTWSGGTYLDSSGRDDIQGFRIYRSPTLNSAVDLSLPIDAVPAYPGGWISDGFGLGGFGLGGFGRAAGSYSWTAGSLQSGVWQFCVIPYDKAGNDRGTGQIVNVSVSAAPRPPALSPEGKRLDYLYAGSETRQITLNWLPSPS